MRLEAFQIMAGALDKKRVESNLMSYEGPFGVGYCVAFFEPDGEDASRTSAGSTRRHSTKKFARPV
jgi:hypothetical protein